MAFKVHYGKCTYEGCKGSERSLIVVSKGWCQYCNYEHKQKKKKEAGKKSRPYKYKRESTGELAFFKTILEVRGAKSEISGEKLIGFDIRWFSHILTKAAYPSYRLFDKNIVLKTIKEHEMWETQKHKLKDKPEWTWVFEREQELKEMYYKTVIK